MHTLFGKHFINFDKYISIDSLMSMKPRISAFIANNGVHLKPVKYPNGCLLNRSMQGVTDLQKQFETNPDQHHDAEFRKNCIANDTFGSYIMYEDENVVQGSYSLNLRYTLDYKNKQKSSACRSIDSDQDFEFFYEWLDQQNIFSDYGRVNFFVTHQGSKTEIHRDYINPGSDRSQLTTDQFDYISNSTEPEQFILINFSTRKQFFLYNPDHTKKYPVTGICNWFDSSNFHGTEVVTQSAYSLRIDGIFSDKFYNQIKLM
jgi:hypothetical protein